MKTYQNLIYGIYTVPLLLLGGVATAQDYTDAERFGRQDIEGTARSQAMGSAFGALGADLTAPLINPAGLAQYRATEAGLTLGVNAQKSDTKTPDGINGSDDRIYVPLNQLGVAFSFGLVREATQGVVGHSFFVGYNKLADFSNNSVTRRPHSKNSYLDYFCSQKGTNKYEGDLAFEGEMVFDDFSEADPVTGEKVTYEVTHNAWEYVRPVAQPDGSFAYDFDQDMREGAQGGAINTWQYQKERGYKGETDFSYAMNVSNKFFWGASIGVQTFSYTRKIQHNETYYYNESHFPAKNNITFELPNGGVPPYDAPATITYNTRLDQDAAGVNFKAGALYKPINELRIGVAVHSPTFYSVSETYETDFQAGNEKRQFSPISDTEYRFRTAGRVAVSLAGVIGSLGVVSVDYERTSPNKGKFRESDDGPSTTMDLVNATVEEALQGVNVLRAGLEFKPMPILAVRAGYKTQTSPFKDKFLDYDYVNRSISGGIGIRIDNFFLDLAYINTKTSADIWTLPYNEEYMYGPNVASKLEKLNHNVAITAGF